MCYIITSKAILNVIFFCFIDTEMLSLNVYQWYLGLIYIIFSWQTSFSRKGCVHSWAYDVWFEVKTGVSAPVYSITNDIDHLSNLVLVFVGHLSIHLYIHTPALGVKPKSCPF